MNITINVSITIAVNIVNISSGAASNNISNIEDAASSFSLIFFILLYITFIPLFIINLANTNIFAIHYWLHQ